MRLACYAAAARKPRRPPCALSRQGEQTLGGDSRAKSRRGQRRCSKPDRSPLSLREALEHQSTTLPCGGRDAGRPCRHCVDEGIPHQSSTLVPLFEHVRLPAQATRSRCLSPSSSEQAWLDGAGQFRTCIEVHQPADHQEMAYLATTRKTAAFISNRTAVMPIAHAPRRAATIARQLPGRAALYLACAMNRPLKSCVN